jgi:Diacylglycerol kinase catalytic domain
MRIAVLSNPTSHSNQAAMPGIRELLNGHPDVLHREIDAITDVPPLLREWAGQGIDLLVVNGGDGTIQAVMTEMINRQPFGRPPPLAVVPGGKTNMFAMDLGGRGKPHQVLAKIIALADSGAIPGRIRERALVGLRRAPDAPIIFGTFFGTAAVVRGIEYCRAKVYPLGLPNIVSHAVACSIIAGGSLRRHHAPDSPFRAEEIGITLDDGERLSGRYFLILVSSLTRLILGMKPFVNKGEGHLNFLSVDHSPAKVFKAATTALILRPKEFLPRGTTCRRVDKVELHLDCPVTLDGEFFHPDPSLPVVLEGGRSLPFVEL